jgi:RNA polymerase sigma-70 factor (ECF subfamily)
LGDPLHQLTVNSAPVPSPAREAPDLAELTRQMAAGDDDAYRAFHDAYFDRLWRYLLVVAAGDEEAAREALQATLVRLVRHIKVFADEAVFWSWLTVLARSALSDQRRTQRRYLAFLDRFLAHARVEQAVLDNGEADAKLLALLERNVASLPADERELVRRKYASRQPVREIAGELQTSEKAVESRLSRVRQKLRAAILHDLKNEPPG